MAKQTIDEDVDSVKEALLDRLQPNDDELFAEPAYGITAAEATYLQALRARITAANLVDKTAAETISKAWNFTARPQVAGVDCIIDGDYASAPTGAMAWWPGLLADIPSGWALCNGENGTEDLMDLYLMGAAVGVEPGQKGGAHSLALSLSQLPTHTHTGTSDSDGAHTHSYLKPASKSNVCAYDGTTRYLDSNSRSTGSAGAHTHAAKASGDTGGGQAIDNRPASKGLALIIKL